MSFSGKVVNRKDNSPMVNIPVTDGRNVVFTDENGRFCLNGWERARMISVCVLTERHNDWYLPIEGHTGDFNFVIDPTKQKEESFCFLHTSDTEIENRPDNAWISFAKECAEKTSAAFFMHTGDLCREDGVKRHYLAMNRETVGCPVRYCIGNHDFIGEKYGEEIYEKLYGPAWYSFNYGNYHFACLSIGVGDNPSGYLPDDQWLWLINDLETAGKDKKLVVCCHDNCASDPTGFSRHVGDTTINLREKGLVAWVYGHYHVNAAHEYDGVINVTVSRPDSGGIDSSPAGFGKIDLDGEKVTTEVIFNSPECDKTDDCIWQTKIDGNVEFSAPVLYEDAVFVATSDDSLPKKCGVTKLCAKSGKILWFFETKGSVKGDIAVTDKKLYVQDSYGTLTCLDTESGNIVWQAQSTLARYDFTRMGVLLADDYIIAGTQSNIHAYNKENGTLIWNTSMPGGENSPAAIIFDPIRKNLIVSRHWKCLCCLDLTDGHIVWENYDRHQCWFRSSTPYIENDDIYLGGMYTVAKLCATDGKTAFAKSSKGRMDVKGAPVTDGQTLFYPTADKGIMAVDKETLEFKGFFTCGGACIFSSPYIYGDVKTVESSPVIFDDKLVFTAADGYIYVYNKDTFELVKKISAGAPIIAPAKIYDGSVIACTFFGKIAAFEL